MVEGLWSSIGADGRDPRLGRFASGGALDGALPSGRMLGVLESLELPSGPDDVPFAGATWDEAAGMLAAAAALESRAAALKLALVRQLIRRHAPAVPDPATGEIGMPDPSSWGIGLLHEIAAVLRISVQSAGPVAQMAWELEARLPGVGELLAAGVLSWLTAKIITDEFSVLDGDALAEAQRLLLDHDLAADDMIPGKIRRLCQRIADTVDPEGAARRREQKERDEARVQFYRTHGGAGALFATGLPADEALKSEANIQKRALEYKAAGIAEKMDFLRVLALVDLTNGVSVPARLELWHAEQDQGTKDQGTKEQSKQERSGDHDPGRRDRDGTGGGPGAESPDGDGGPGISDPGLPTLANMTYPLATVLGQASRPGEAAGYGSLDPALVRKLADAAARSPRSRFCVTFTDDEGHAAAHGCARLIREKGNTARNGRRGKSGGPPGGGRDGPSGSRPSGDSPSGSGWSFSRDTSRPGPEGGYGSWVLTLPGGSRYRLDMHKVPLHDCDHRYATDAYRPGYLLRHLVQVRDGQCTFTGCSHPASNSDFEHTVPYHKGGATDACNGAARSRRCHQVKQSKAWNVTQPQPGWHRWEAPSGRAYTKGPKNYPA